MTTSQCVVCKKEFSRPPSQLRKGTCSRECGYKIRIVKPNSGQFKKGDNRRLGYKYSDEAKHNMSVARMKSVFRTGVMHPRWKYGSRGYYGDMANKVIAESGVLKVCSICEINTNIHVHHKDRNYKNNDISNLMYLCSSCHMKTHHAEDKKNCICKYCNKKFVSGRRPSMFCSRKCRVIEWKLRNRNALSQRLEKL